MNAPPLAEVSTETSAFPVVRPRPRERFETEDEYAAQFSAVPTSEWERWIASDPELVREREKRTAEAAYYRELAERGLYPQRTATDVE